MSLVSFCEQRIKPRFWPRVAARISRQELGVEELADSLRNLAAEDGHAADDEIEFRVYLKGKLGLM